MAGKQLAGMPVVCFLSLSGQLLRSENFVPHCVTSGRNLEAGFGEELVEIIGNLLIKPIEL